MAARLEKKEMNCRHTNVALTTKYLVRLHQLRRDIQDTAEEFAEEVVEDLQQYVQHELTKVADYIENVSDILAVHTKGHSLIFSGDRQQSKDTSTSREEVSKLFYSSDGGEDSHYHVSSTKESLPCLGAAPSKSTKQYKAECNKQHLVQVALEPAHGKHISATTKLLSSEASQKTNGGQRVNANRSNDLAVIGYSLARNATTHRQPKQDPKHHKLQSTGYAPISQEKPYVRRPFPPSNNGFNDRGDAGSRICTEEKGHPMQSLEQNKLKTKGPPHISQDKSYVRRPFPPFNNEFKDI